MDPQKFIWIDGQMIPWPEAKIHILTHALHYGTAVFEGIRFYKTPKYPAIFRLMDHIDRLYRSAGAFEMQIPFTKEEFIKATLDTVRANELTEGYIRPLVYLGYGKMGLCPVGAPVNCAIMAWPWGKYLDKPVATTIISNYCRVHPRSGEMAAKISGVYYNSALASLEAKKRGVDEAILLDTDGFIAEGPGENIFIITQDNVLVTPPLGTILPGITRATVLELASYDLKDILPIAGIVERPITPIELKRAKEAFFTGTAAEITGIVSVDGETIGTGELGPVTGIFCSAYSDLVHGLVPARDRWLGYVY